MACYTWTLKPYLHTRGLASWAAQGLRPVISSYHIHDDSDSVNDTLMTQVTGSQVLNATLPAAIAGFLSLEPSDSDFTSQPITRLAPKSKVNLTYSPPDLISCSNHMSPIVYWTHRSPDDRSVLEWVILEDEEWSFSSRKTDISQNGGRMAWILSSNFHQPA